MQKNKIVYVITDNRGLRRYYPFENFSDFEYFDLQKEVITLLSRYNNNNIFKASNSVYNNNDNYMYNPILEWIEETKIQNINISNKKFVDEIVDANLIIIDYPCTTLLEAVSFNSDIITFYSEECITIKDCEKALEDLKKRVYIGQTKNEFLQLIQLYLENKLLKHKKDQRFKLNYSVYINNEKANERALNAIKKILRGEI